LVGANQFKVTPPFFSPAVRHGGGKSAPAARALPLVLQIKPRAIKVSANILNLVLINIFLLFYAINIISEKMEKP
jgi:hypothetical protein